MEELEFSYQPAVDPAALCASFSDDLVLTRKGGGGAEVPYLSYATVLYRLISATGNRFTFTLHEEKVENGNKTVLGRLTIPGLGTREQYGVVSTTGGGEDAVAKGAASDALKKCAEAFGIGLQLKRGDTNDPPPGRIHGPWTKEQFDAIKALVLRLFGEVEGLNPTKVIADYVRERYGDARLHPKLYLTEAEAEDVVNHYKALLYDAAPAAVAPPKTKGSPKPSPADMS